MKITKRVNTDYGNIDLTITGLPEPVCKEITLRGLSWSNNDWDSITRTEVDGFSYGGKAWSFGEPIPSLKVYKKTDPVKDIADVILERISMANSAVSKFVADNTESAEFVAREDVIEKLDAEDKLYYRNKKGQFSQLL